jgi:hypothetical protein
MTTLPITGSVDPGFLAGLTALQQGLTGAGNASATAGEKAEASGSAWSRAYATIGTGAQHFNSLRAAVTNVMADLGALADGVTTLATEQDQLDRTSRRLGLNFDDMASAAGRFTDETQAMGLATTLAAQGVVMTQQQSEGLMTAIGAASVRQNISMQEAIDNTTTAIVRGRVTGLVPYGEEARRLAGSAHTANERMAAIAATAEHVARASDTAADQVARLRDGFDDSKRTVAAAFVRELAVLQNITHDTGTASERADDLGDTFAAVGETIATAMMRAVVGVQMLGAVANVVIGGITGPVSALSRAASIEGVGLGPARARLAALREGFNDEARNGRSQQASRELERLTAQAEAITARAEGAGARRARARTPEGRLEAAQEAALDRAYSNDQPIERPDRPRGGTRQTAAQIAQARLTSQAGARTMVGQIEADALDRRAAMMAQNVAATDRLIGIGDPNAPTMASLAANDNAMAQSEMADALADKERRRLDSLREAHESYAGRLAELQGAQVNGAQRAAEFTSSAFDAMGRAIGTHVQALVEGRESVGVALQGMLSDTLISVGKEAVIQGGMEIAKGVAALAGVVTAPLAPGHFAAGAAFLAVGAAAGVAGAALAPSAPAAGAGAGNSGARGALNDRASGGSDAMAPIQINYYAPVIGGREATDSELGTRLDRFDDAARQRLRRAA